MTEEKLSTTPEAIELPALGYGTPEATISYTKHKENGELTPEVETAMVEIITGGQCLVEVTDQDDGCIDGRPAIRVTYADAEGKVHEATINPDDTNERYKVAGGGYMTGLAIELALRPPQAGIDAVLRQVVLKLAQKGIYCGAHSGPHRSHEKHATDCGANDKFEIILQDALVHAAKIGETTAALCDVVGRAYDDEAQKSLTSNWAQTLQREAPVSVTGEERYDIILKALAEAQVVEAKGKPLGVMKELAGGHKEDFIIINLRPGFTFSQAMLRELLGARFPDLDEKDMPQAFVVDMPRVIQLADAIQEDDQEDAMATQAGIAYQLATAATLTDGSLRVFIVK